jgi:hypothetical protein
VAKPNFHIMPVQAAGITRDERWSIPNQINFKHHRKTHYYEKGLNSMTSNETSSEGELYGLDPESLQMVLDTVGQLKKRLLTPEKIGSGFSF